MPWQDGAAGSAWNQTSTSAPSASSSEVERSWIGSPVTRRPPSRPSDSREQEDRVQQDVASDLWGVDLARQQKFAPAVIPGLHHRELRQALLNSFKDDLRHSRG